MGMVGMLMKQADETGKYGKGDVVWSAAMALHLRG